MGGARLGERARGVGHGRPRAGHARDAGDRQAVSAAEAEAWCAKAQPKQNKQTTMGKKREATISSA